VDSVCLSIIFFYRGYTSERYILRNALWNAAGAEQPPVKCESNINVNINARYKQYSHLLSVIVNKNRINQKLITISGPEIEIWQD
jgi:hypothetical protein